MRKLLSGKSVLVTGAGRNIGRAIAIEMAKEGANVLFAEIDKRRAASLEKELRDYSVASKGFIADISRQEEVDALAESLAKYGTAIDILVNNVGIQSGPDDGKQKFRFRSWQSVFEANLFGPLTLTGQVASMMEAEALGGSILFITSIHQWVVRRRPSYSASKAALGMLVKEMALEFAPKQIRVNGIAPGYVEEDDEGAPLPHPYTPLHQSSINPAYIGRAAVFLASEYHSRFTTGTVLKVDAGLSLYNHILAQEGFPPS